MTPRELSQYARICKRMGIGKLSIGNVTLEMDLSHDARKGPLNANGGHSQSTTEDSATLTTPSQEDLMFWSSGNTDA